MDWEVFDRMYSEEFSIDLLHSWRQVVICLLTYFISSRLKIQNVQQLTCSQFIIKTYCRCYSGVFIDNFEKPELWILRTC